MQVWLPALLYQEIESPCCWMLKVSVNVQLKLSLLTLCKYIYMSGTKSITVFETIAKVVVKCF